MKRQIKLYILLALSSLVMASPAAADGWIFGANTGTMQVDVSGVSNPTNIGFMAGYEIGVGVGDIAFEGEITRTLSAGSYLGADVEVETEAIYVAFRTAGPVYFKGRIGTLQEEVRIGSVSGSETGTSMGLGVGFSLAVVQLELDITQVEEDVTYLSVGVVF